MSIANTQAKYFGFFIQRLELDNWDKQTSEGGGGARPN